MTRGSTALAAFLLLTFAAAPAAAEPRGTASGAYAVTAAGDAPGASGRQSVSIERSEFLPPDTRGAPRTTMIGSVPVLDNVDFGLGLFAVTGSRVREREFRRSDPLQDMAPRTRRVAAVGMRMSF